MDNDSEELGSYIGNQGKEKDRIVKQIKVANLGEDGGYYDQKYAMEEELDIIVREWGARMTTKNSVPPVTEKYEVIDEYVIVANEAE
ncbi:hypothetical protein KI387_000084, partial [Taxus chinensis]